MWFDRAGKELTEVAAGSGFEAPSISRDGRRIAGYRTAGGNVDVWVVEARGVSTRFTFEPAVDNFPLWSPDGKQIVFSSTRLGGPHNLFLKPAAGPGDEKIVLETPEVKTANDWSLDGRYLLYRSSSSKTGYDLWALPLEAGPPKPFPVVRTSFAERDGQFSPDTKWIAYQSDESGRFEIYVQPFPVPGAKVQISTSGGTQVRWRRDGQELFYIALDGRLMAVAIRGAADGQSIEAGTPVPLFLTRVGGAIQGFLRQQYDVSPDGQRVLMNTISEEEATPPLTVVLNWNARRE